MPGPNDKDKASPCNRPAPILRAQRVLQEMRQLMLQSPRAQAPIPNSHWLVPPFPPLPPHPPSEPLPDLVPANVVEPPLPSGRPVTRPPRLTPRRRLEEVTQSLTNRRMKETACSSARGRQLTTPPRESAAPSTVASPVISANPPSYGRRVSTPPSEEAQSRPQPAQSSDDQNKDLDLISVDNYMPPLPPMPGPALANLMPPPPPRPRPSSAKPRVSKAQGSEKRAADSTTAEGPLKLHCTQTDRHAPRCATNCLPCMRRALRTQGTRLT